MVYQVSQIYKLPKVLNPVRQIHKLPKAINPLHQITRIHKLPKALNPLNQIPKIQQLPKTVRDALTPKRKADSFDTLDSTIEGDGGFLMEEPSVSCIEVESIPQVINPPFVKLVNDTEPSTLRQAMGDFLHQEYNHVIEAGDPSIADPVSVEMDAFSTLFRHVLSLESLPIAKEMAYEELNEYISPRLTLRCEGMSTLTPKQIAKLIFRLSNYYEYHQQAYPAKDYPHSCHLEELKSEYLRQGVHNQVKSMVDNRLLLLHDDEAIENDDGTLSTRLPEDVALISEMQLAVARESLGESMLPDVLRACNEELLNLVGGMMFYIETSWKTVSVERLCACVNDAQSLLDQCDARNEHILGNTEDNEEDESSHELLKEFSLLSLHAARYLCERIFIDLDILATVGTKEWEKDDNQVIDVALETLRDYFDDFKQWIPAEYYFPKILKNCMDFLLRFYLESFFTNTMANGLNNLAKAVERLQMDWSKLWDFFGSENIAYHGRAGFYGKENVWHRLHILEATICILTTTSEPAKVQGQMSAILKQLGPDTGIAAVLHLFGLQRRRIKAKEAEEWHATIALAYEHACMQSLCEPLYQIPDLRNSKFVRRMRSSKVGDVNTLTNRLVKSRPLASVRMAQNSKSIVDHRAFASWRQ